MSFDIKPEDKIPTGLMTILVKRLTSGSSSSSR
jgi:hypothetical protein